LFEIKSYYLNFEGTRFDTRRNAFDWDLHMKLAERGFKRLNAHEYGDWRENGLAFHLTRQDYTQANRTLASAFVFQASDGTKQARRGYWGDIITGPFLSHGLLPIDNDDPQIQAKANDKFVKTATDVSEYNVLKLLSQLQEQNNQIKIVLLPLNSIGDLCTASKERYRHLQFDLIYLGCGLTHYLNEQGENFSSSIMSRGSTLILELPTFLLDLKKEQLEQLEKRYDEMAKNIGCIQQDNEELKANAFKIYKYNRS
jgi:dynein assembly factor 3